MFNNLYVVVLNYVIDVFHIVCSKSTSTAVVIGSINQSNWVFSAYKKIDERDDRNLVECNFDELKPGQGQYCKVKANDLMKEACTLDKKYGFDTGTPCLLLKLNRVKLADYHCLFINVIF